jgi:hypothetical protein
VGADEPYILKNSNPTLKQTNLFEGADLLSELDSLRDDGKLNKTRDDDITDTETSVTNMPGFFQKLLTEILRNLEIHIRGVHIRWVDRVSSPSQPFAMGLCAQTIHVYNLKDSQNTSSSKSSTSSPVSRPPTSERNNKNSSPQTNLIPDQKITPPKTLFGVAFTALSGAGRTSTAADDIKNDISSNTRNMNTNTNTPERTVSKGLEVDMLSAYVQVSSSSHINLFNLKEGSKSDKVSDKNKNDFIPTTIDGIDLISCELSDFERAMEKVIPMRGRSSNRKDPLPFRTRSSSTGISDSSSLSFSSSSIAGDTTSTAETHGVTPLLRSHLFFDAFALPPLNATCQIVFSRSQQDMSIPQQYIETHISQLALRFQSRQYAVLIALSSGFESFKLRRRFDQIRPIQRLIVWRLNSNSKLWGVKGINTSSISTTISPFPHRPLIDPTRSRIARSWWRFAVRASVEEVSRSGPFMRWRCISERRILRIAYIWLYKRLRCGYHSPRQWGSKRVRALQRLQARRAALDDTETNDDGDDKDQISSQTITEKPGEWLHKHSLPSLLGKVLDERIFARPWIKWAVRYKTILTVTDSSTVNINDQDVHKREDFLKASSDTYTASTERNSKLSDTEIITAVNSEDWDKVDALLKKVEPVEKSLNEYTRLNAHEMSLLELLEERLGADDLYIFRLLAESQIDSEGGVAYLKESAKNVAEERRRARHDRLKNIPHDSESDSEQSMASSMISYASSLADTPQIQFAAMTSTGSESDVSSNAQIEFDPLPGRRKQKTESLESISTQKKQVIYDDDHASVQSDFSRSDSGDEDSQPENGVKGIRSTLQSNMHVGNAISASNISRTDSLEKSNPSSLNGVAGATLRWLGLDWLTNLNSGVTNESLIKINEASPSSNGPSGREMSRALPMTSSSIAADTQRREIFAAIGYDPRIILQPYHSSYVVTRVLVRLASVSITLLVDGSSISSETMSSKSAGKTEESESRTRTRTPMFLRPLLCLQLNILNLDIQQRPSSQKINLVLADATLEQGNGEKVEKEQTQTRSDQGPPLFSSGLVPLPFKTLVYTTPLQSNMKNLQKLPMDIRQESEDGKNLVSVPIPQELPISSSSMSSVSGLLGSRIIKPVLPSSRLTSSSLYRSSSTSHVQGLRGEYSNQIETLSRTEIGHKKPLLFLSFETFPDDAEIEEENETSQIGKQYTLPQAVSPSDLPLSRDGNKQILGLDGTSDDGLDDTMSINSASDVRHRSSSAIFAANDIAMRALGLTGRVGSSNRLNDDGSADSVRSSGSGGPLKSRSRAISQALIQRKEVQKEEEIENKRKAFRKPRWTSTARVAFTLRIQPLEVVVSKEAMNVLQSFFNISESKKHLPSWHQSPFLHLKRFIPRSVIPVLQTQYRESVAVDIEFDAPILLFPLDESNARTEILIIDLGLVTIKSARPLIKECIDTESRISRTGIDIYTSELFRMKVLLTRADVPWRDPTQQNQRGLLLFQPISLSISVHVVTKEAKATIPMLLDIDTSSSQSTGLSSLSPPPLRIDVTIPSILCRLSDAQMNPLLRIFSKYTTSSIRTSSTQSRLNISQTNEANNEGPVCLDEFAEKGSHVSLFSLPPTWALYQRSTESFRAKTVSPFSSPTKVRKPVLSRYSTPFKTSMTSTTDKEKVPLVSNFRKQNVTERNSPVFEASLSLRQLQIDLCQCSVEDLEKRWDLNWFNLVDFKKDEKVASKAGIEHQQQSFENIPSQVMYTSLSAAFGETDLLVFKVLDIRSFLVLRQQQTAHRNNRLSPQSFESNNEQDMLPKLQELSFLPDLPGVEANLVFSTLTILDLDEKSFGSSFQQIFECSSNQNMQSDFLKVTFRQQMSQSTLVRGGHTDKNYSNVFLTWTEKKFQEGTFNYKLTNPDCIESNIDVCLAPCKFYINEKSLSSLISKFLLPILQHQLDKLFISQLNSPQVQNSQQDAKDSFINADLSSHSVSDSVIPSENGQMLLRYLTCKRHDRITISVNSLEIVLTSNGRELLDSKFQNITLDLTGYSLQDCSFYSLTHSRKANASLALVQDEYDSAWKVSGHVGTMSIKDVLTFERSEGCDQMLMHPRIIFKGGDLKPNNQQQKTTLDINEHISKQLSFIEFDASLLPVLDFDTSKIQNQSLNKLTQKSHFPVIDLSSLLSSNDMHAITQPKNIRNVFSVTARLSSLHVVAVSSFLIPLCAFLDSSTLITLLGTAMEKRSALRKKHESFVIKQKEEEEDTLNSKGEGIRVNSFKVEINTMTLYIPKTWDMSTRQGLPRVSSFPPLNMTNPEVNVSNTSGVGIFTFGGSENSPSLDHDSSSSSSSSSASSANENLSHQTESFENRIIEQGLSEFIAFHTGPVSLSNTFSPYQSNDDHILWRQKVRFVLQGIHIQATKLLQNDRLEEFVSKGIAFRETIVKEFDVDATLLLDAPFTVKGSNKNENALTLNVSVSNVVVECADAFILLFKIIWRKNAAALLRLAQYLASNQSSSPRTPRTPLHLEIALQVAGIWIHVSRDRLISRANSSKCLIGSRDFSRHEKLSRLYLSSQNNSTLSLEDLASIHIEKLDIKSNFKRGFGATQSFDSNFKSEISILDITVTDARIDRGGFQSRVFSSRQTEPSRSKLLSLVIDHILEENKPLSVSIHAKIGSAKLHIVPTFVDAMLSFYYRLVSLISINGTSETVISPTAYFKHPFLFSTSNLLKRLELTTLSSSKTHQTIHISLEMCAPEVWFYASPSSHAIVVRGSSLSGSIHLSSVSSVKQEYGEYIHKLMTSAIKAITLKDKRISQTSTDSLICINVPTITSSTSSYEFLSADFSAKNLGLFLHDVVSKNAEDPVQTSVLPQRSASTIWAVSRSKVSSPDRIKLSQNDDFGTDGTYENLGLDVSSGQSEGVSDGASPSDLNSSIATPTQRSFVQFLSGNGISPGSKDMKHAASVGIVRRIVLPFSIDIKAEARDLSPSPLAINVSDIISKRAARRNEGIWAERAESAAAAVIGGVLAAARSLGSLAKSLSSKSATYTTLPITIQESYAAVIGGGGGGGGEEEEEVEKKEPNIRPHQISIEVEGMQREISHYNREAAKQGAAILSYALEKLPKHDSQERLQKQFSRPILAQQVLTYHVSRFSVNGPITVCISRNELLSLSEVIDSLRTVGKDVSSLSRNQSDVQDVEDKGTDVGPSPSHTTASSSATTTTKIEVKETSALASRTSTFDILPILRPRPNCYAAHVELSSVKIVFVKRDSITRTEVLLSDSSKWNGVSTPLLRAEISKAEIFLNAAPILGTIRAQGIASIDHSNALVSRWESVLEPWPFDVLVAVLRSALSSETRGTERIERMDNTISSTFPTKLRSTRINADDFALSSAALTRAKGSVWYPPSLLSRVSADGLKLLRRHAEGTLWQTDNIISEGDTVKRWYDFGNDTTDNKNEMESDSHGNNWVDRFFFNLPSSRSTDHILSTDKEIYQSTTRNTPVSSQRNLQPVEVTLSSSAPLRINASTAGVASLAAFRSLLPRTQKIITHNDILCNSPIYWAQNDTGCEMQYLAKNDSSNTKEKGFRNLEKGVRVPILAPMSLTLPQTNDDGTNEKFNSIDSELFAWPQERNWPPITESSSLNNVGGLKLCLSIRSPVSSSSSSLSLTSHEVEGNTTFTDPSFLSNIAIDTAPSFSSLESWQPLVNSAICGYNNKNEQVNDDGFHHLSVERSIAQQVLFRSAPESHLPQPCAVFESTVSLDEGTHIPLTRNIRIRSTMSCANFLEINVRIDAFIVPRGIESSLLNQFSPVWSCPLAPFKACWVPATLSHWSSKDPLMSIDTVVFRLVIGEDHFIQVLTSDLTPKDDLLTTRSTFEPLKCFQTSSRIQSEPSVFSSISWGKTANELMQVCLPAFVDSEHTDSNNVVSIDNQHLQIARARSFEQFSCACINAKISTSLSSSSCSRCEGRASLWPSFQQCAVKTKSGNLINSTNHGLLACLSVHSPVSFQNRLPKACDVLIARLKRKPNLTYQLSSSLDSMRSRDFITESEEESSHLFMEKSVIRLAPGANLQLLMLNDKLQDNEEKISMDGSFYERSSAVVKVGGLVDIGSRDAPFIIRVRPEGMHGWSSAVLIPSGYTFIDNISVPIPLGATACSSFTDLNSLELSSRALHESHSSRLYLRTRDISGHSTHVGLDSLQCLHGGLRFSLFASHILVNKTGVPILYESSVTEDLVETRISQPVSGEFGDDVNSELTNQEHNLISQQSNVNVVSMLSSAASNLFSTSKKFNLVAGQQDGAARLQDMISSFYSSSNSFSKNNTSSTVCVSNESETSTESFVFLGPLHVHQIGVNLGSKIDVNSGETKFASITTDEEALLYWTLSTNSEKTEIYSSIQGAIKRRTSIKSEKPTTTRWQLRLRANNVDPSPSFSIMSLPFQQSDCSLPLLLSEAGCTIGNSQDICIPLASSSNSKEVSTPLLFRASAHIIGLPNSFGLQKCKCFQMSDDFLLPFFPFLRPIHKKCVTKFVSHALHASQYPEMSNRIPLSIVVVFVPAFVAQNYTSTPLYLRLAPVINGTLASQASSVDGEVHENNPHCIDLIRIEPGETRAIHPLHPLFSPSLTKTQSSYWLPTSSSHSSRTSGISLSLAAVQTSYCIRVSTGISTETKQTVPLAYSSAVQTQTHWSGSLVLSHDALGSAKSAKARGILEGVSIERTISTPSKKSQKMSCAILSLPLLPCQELVQTPSTFLRVIRRHLGSLDAVCSKEEDVRDSSSFNSYSINIENVSKDENVDENSGTSLISFYPLINENKRRDMFDIQESQPDVIHSYLNQWSSLDICPYILINRTRYNFAFTQSGCPRRLCPTLPMSAAASIAQQRTSDSNDKLLSFLSEATKIDSTPESLSAGSVLPFAWYEPELGSNGGAHLLELYSRVSSDDSVRHYTSSPSSPSNSIIDDSKHSQDFLLGRFDISTPGVTLLREGHAASFGRQTPVPEVDIVLQILAVPRGQDLVRIVCIQTASQPVGVPFFDFTRSSQSIHTSLTPTRLDHDQSSLYSSPAAAKAASSSFSSTISDAETFFTRLGKAPVSKSPNHIGPNHQPLLAANPLNAFLGRHARLRVRLSNVIINLVDSSYMNPVEKGGSYDVMKGLANEKNIALSIHQPSIGLSNGFHRLSNTEIAALIPANHIAGSHVLSLFIAGVDLTATDEGFVDNHSYSVPNQESPVARPFSWRATHLLKKKSSAVPDPLLSIFRSLTLSLDKLSIYRPLSASPHVYKEVVFSGQVEGSGSLSSLSDANTIDKDELSSSSSLSSISSSSTTTAPLSMLSSTDMQPQFLTFSLTQSPFRIKVPGDAAVVAVDPFSWRNLGFATSQIVIDIQPGQPKRPMCMFLSLDIELAEAFLKYVTVSQRIIHHQQFFIDTKEESVMETRQQTISLSSDRGKIVKSSETFSGLFRLQSNTQRSFSLGTVSSSKAVSFNHPFLRSSSSVHRSTIYNKDSSNIHRSVHFLRSSRKMQLSNVSTSNVSYSIEQLKRISSSTVPLLFQREVDWSLPLAPFISHLCLSRGFVLQISWQGDLTTDPIDSNVTSTGIWSKQLGEEQVLPIHFSNFINLLHRVPTISEPVSISVPSVSVSDTALSLPGKKSLLEKIIDAIVPRIVLQQLFSPWRLPGLIQLAFRMWLSE